MDIKFALLIRRKVKKKKKKNMPNRIYNEQECPIQGTGCIFVQINRLMLRK
jgi:hypothetical protein